MQAQGHDISSINQLLGRAQRQGDALGVQSGSINIASEAEELESEDEEEEDDDSPDAIEILERDYDPGQEDGVEDEEESDEPEDERQRQWQARQNQLSEARLRQR